jgi:hypothetical protein
MNNDDEFSDNDELYLERYYASIEALDDGRADLYEKGFCPFCGSNLEGKSYCYSCVKSHSRPFDFKKYNEESRW